MSNINLGIDISKLELSVALLIDKKPIKAKFANDDSGFKKLYKWLCKNKAKTIKVCMEATGHYCFSVADFLYNKGYKVYVVNPFCIKSFANSQLTRNKTDEADAVIIANYINKNDANPYKPASEITRKTRELNNCLDAMKVHRAQIKTRLSDSNYLPKEVISAWKSTIKHFDKQIKKIELNLQSLIKADKELKQDFVNLQTIDGVGATTATSIIALVPDISGFSNARQLAAFVGVTPQQKLSGTSLKGRTRLSKIGSARLRKAIYFPAISARHHNPIVKKFCDNLQRRSKCKMVVIGAAMRKLMHIIFAILKYKVPFNPEINT